MLGGFGNPDVQRLTVLGATARGGQKIWFGGGALHAEHVFAYGDWYLKPEADFNATYVSAGSTTETGAVANLHVLSGDKSYFSVRPAVEVGGEIRTGSGLLMRPRMSVGLIQFLSDPSPVARAELAGFSSFAVVPLTVKSHVDRTFLDLRVGIDVVTAGGATIALNGFGNVASTSFQAGGGLGVKLPF